MDEEHRLIRRVQQHGDRVAADALVRTYYDEILRFAARQTPSREEALDVTQETFIGMLKTIGRFDPRRSSLRTWLYRIATNKLVDYYRARARRQQVEPLSAEAELVVDDADFTRRADDQAFCAQVGSFVNGLPADTQRIFRLHLWGEQTFAQIAAVLDMPEASVKARYYRLIQSLRREFADER